MDAGRIDGKRRRKFFATKKEAQAHADKMCEARASRGNLVFSLTSSQQIEAAQAFKDLEPVNATVRDAVAYFLKHAKPKGGCKTVQEFVKEFLLTKTNAGNRPRYLKELRCKLNRFSVDFGNQKLNEISRLPVQTWLDKQPFAALTKQNYHRDLGIFFRLAQKRGYCADNVISQIERPQAPETQTGIFTVDETFRLLHAAHILPKLKLIPYLAIGFFAGLRASELEALDWNEINLRERTIEVLAANAKNARSRLVDISENLAAWLEPHQEMQGSVTPEWRP